MSGFRKAQSLEDAKKIIERIVEKQHSVLLWQQSETSPKKTQVDAIVNGVKIIQKKIYVEIFCESEIMNKFDSSQFVFLGELKEQLVLLKGNLLKISRFSYHLEIVHPTLLKEYRGDKRIDLFDKKLKIELTFNTNDRAKRKTELGQLESISLGGIGILVPSGVSVKYQTEKEVLINSINSKPLQPAIKASVVYTNVSKYSNALGGSLVHIGLRLHEKLEMSQMADLLVTEEMI